MVSNAFQSLPARMLACTEGFLRDFVLARARVGTGARPLATRLPALQTASCVVARAISRAANIALHVWRGGCIGECATDAVAADDCLLSASLAGIARAEHRCERLTGRAGDGCFTRVTGRANQCSNGGTAIEGCGGDKLADGAQR